MTAPEIIWGGDADHMFGNTLQTATGPEDGVSWKKSRNQPYISSRREVLMCDKRDFSLDCFVLWFIVFIQIEIRWRNKQDQIRPSGIKESDLDAKPTKRPLFT